MIAAVLDVNVLISAILGPLGHPRQIVLAWEANQFAVITSDGIIAELRANLRLPRIARRYNVRNPQDVQWIEGLLRVQAQVVFVPHHEVRSVTGDPEDDLVLATARLAQADYLVTGDHGLLVLGQYEATKVVSPRDFLQGLAQRGSP
jgi:uncharacterized protein